MKLSDLQTTNKIKLLVIGEAGVGKTVFACSGPGETKLFDFDNKVDSAKSFYGAINPEKLNHVDVDQYPLDSTDGRTYQMFREDLEKLVLQKNTGKPFPFQTVVLDSLTLYADALMNYQIKKNPGMKRAATHGVTMPVLQDYMALGILFRQDMHRLLSLPCNVICTAHPKITKDEDTGVVRGEILLSAGVAAHLPRIFSEVYWAFARKAQPKSPGETPKTERVALTRSNDRFNCRSQIQGLPEWIPLNFEAVQKFTEAKSPNQGELK